MYLARVNKYIYVIKLFIKRSHVCNFVDDNTYINFIKNIFYDKMDLRLFYFDMATSTDVTLLGVSIDNKLTFKNHTDELCRKASYKLQDLHRIRLFYQKNKLIENAFIVSFYMLLQCGCLLVKVHLTKSAKFISGHSKLFILPVKNRTRSYLLSVIMSKTSSYFGDRGL